MRPLLGRFAHPPIIIGATALVAIAAAGFFYFYSAPHVSASYTNPVRGSIVEEVDTTGSVKPAESVDLSFEKSGRISYVSAAVGTHVVAGTRLAAISGADLSAALEQAKAALQVQQAKLDALNAGARPEDVAVTEATVSGAQATLLQAKQSVLDTARDAYHASDDAIHIQVDEFFTGPRTSSPSLALTLSDAQLQISIASDRLSMETLLNGWQAYVASLPDDASVADIDTILTTTSNNLSSVGSYLDEVASGLTKTVPTSGLSAATVQKYQSDIASARTSVSAEITALNTAETAEKNAASALVSAQSQLTLKQAPATAQDIEEQTAQVASAQANVDAAAAELAKTSLNAPFAGVITNNDAHLGATATPGASLISMISDAQFQIEAYVSEADLAKVQVNDVANVKLDAYPNDTPLSAHVVSIDPAATVQDGVSSYKVTLQFNTDDPRIQAGLTANVSIIADTKDDALQVPTSSIVTRGDGQYVLRASTSGDELVKVETGIESAAGMTEIISGISETDRIRSFGTQQ